MSVEAINWAFRVQTKSALKLLLLALADYANENSYVWPSLAALEEKTCQDRKTIIASLKKLEDDGFLVDTGKRTGQTGQIKVYQLDMSKSTENGAIKECRKRNSSKNGTVPDFPSNSTVFPMKEYQISAERVPKTEPVTIKGTIKEPIRNQYNAREDLRTRGVDSQVIDDWCDLRKTKRAKVTKTAVDGIAREAKQAGMLLNDALKMCCENGWQGFRASWIAQKQGHGKETVAERNSRIKASLLSEFEPFTIDMEA